MRWTQKIKTNLARPALLLFIILVLGLLLRIIFFCGMTASDPFAYFLNAYKILCGTYRLQGVNWYYGFRYLMIFPAALFFSIFGIHGISAALWPLICSLSTIVLIYKIGEECIDRETGLLAAFFLSFYPLNVIYSTILLPDVIVSFFSGLSFYFCVMGRKKGSALYYLFSGIMVCCTYFTRIPAVIILIAILFAYLLTSQEDYKKALKGFFIIFLSFLFPVFLVQIFYYFSQGNVLFQFSKMAGFAKYDLKINLIEIKKNPFVSIFRYPLLFFGVRGNIEVGYFYIFIFSACIYCYIAKIKQCRILVLWLFGALLFLQLLPAKVARYLTCTTIPGLLILSAACIHLMRKKEFFTKGKSPFHIIRQMLAVGIVLFLFVSSLHYVRLLTQWKKEENEPFKKAAEYLRTKNFNYIYVYPLKKWSVKILFYFTCNKSISGKSVNAKVKYLSNILSEKDLENSYILIDRNAYRDISITEKKSYNNFMKNYSNRIKEHKIINKKITIFTISRPKRSY
jgi:4-amino-4-deoxy-L-arabinose transferase-like glycosyltransferase